MSDNFSYTTCPRCSAQLPANTAFCSNCGTPLANPQSGFHPQYYGAEPIRNVPADYLIWSIISTLCCCLPLGIAAIIFSTQCKSAISAGDLATAQSKSKTAFMLNIISLLLGLIFNVLYCGALLLPTIHPAREAARRMQCSNKVKQLTIAVHNFHDVHLGLPPLYTTDDDGKPLHSWRAFLLPYVEQCALYDDMIVDNCFTEPWDSPRNLRYHVHNIYPYHCPSLSVISDDNCNYAAIVGVLTHVQKIDAKGGLGIGPNFNHITDGMSNTAMIVETKLPFCWMNPTTDISAEEFSKGINNGAVGSNHAGGSQVGMADGSVRFISNTCDPIILKALATPDGRESVTLD
ncbi:MAG: DUF1559 domain-containing protein [Planctomycetaceae bacterium]|nr:DUF1559 domain-containing protein [Planctomycetaceae bacterium]